MFIYHTSRRNYVTEDFPLYEILSANWLDRLEQIASQDTSPHIYHSLEPISCTSMHAPTTRDERTKKEEHAPF